MKKTIILGLVLILIIVAVIVSSNHTKPVATPNDAWKHVFESYKKGDLSLSSAYQTETGKKVVGWLFSQPWIDTKPIVLERQTTTNKYTVREIFKQQDGAAVVSLVFFKEATAEFPLRNVEQRAVWKFHDVHLWIINGDVYDLYESYILENPVKASAQIILKILECLFVGPRVL